MSIRDKKELIQKIELGEKFEYLLFGNYKPKKDNLLDESCLSQWYDSPFMINQPIPGELFEITFKTAEHYMMYKKAHLFYDYDTAHKILKAKTPKEAKELGRQVKNFDQKKWDENSYDIVLSANLNKFYQTPLTEYLLNTKDKILVETNPNDPIWGVALDKEDKRALNPKEWLGENKLGFILMRVREILKTQDSYYIENYIGW